MSDKVLVQYVGFEVNADARIYTFTVREAPDEPREFTLTIPNEAFSSHRARFQDAPTICSLRLHSELLNYSNHPPITHYSITNSELDEYRAAHLTKAHQKMYTPRQEDY